MAAALPLNARKGLRKNNFGFEGCRIPPHGVARRLKPVRCALLASCAAGDGRTPRHPRHEYPASLRVRGGGHRDRRLYAFAVSGGAPVFEFSFGGAITGTVAVA